MKQNSVDELTRFFQTELLQIWETLGRVFCFFLTEKKKKKSQKGKHTIIATFQFFFLPTKLNVANKRQIHLVHRESLPTNHNDNNDHFIPPSSCQRVRLGRTSSIAKSKAKKKRQPKRNICIYIYLFFVFNSQAQEPLQSIWRYPCPGRCRS